MNLVHKAVRILHRYADSLRESHRPAPGPHRPPGCPAAPFQSPRLSRCSGTLNCCRTSGVRLATARPSFPCCSLPCSLLSASSVVLWNSPTVTCSVCGLPSRRMPSSDRRPRRHLAHRNLQRAAVHDLLAIRSRAARRRSPSPRGSPASPASPGSRSRPSRQAG